MFIQTRKIILDDSFVADPYPVYKLLRDRKSICPFPSNNKTRNTWLVTKYKEIIQVLRDERFARDIYKASTAEEIEFYSSKGANVQILSQHLLNKDRPEHDRIRALLNRAFTTSAVQPLRSKLEELALDILDPYLAKRRMDLIADFAFPFTVTVIGEILGLPREVQISTRDLSSQEAVQNFVSGIEMIVKQRLVEAKDDLVSQMVKLYEIQTITYDELIDNLFLVFVAGHETTMNMIANSVVTLLQHPQQWERLCSKPELLTSIIDELLRYNGSVEKAWVRWATTDIQLGDVLIRKGDQVYAALASGNRDSTLFENGESFCPHRQSSKKHLAFGYGTHYCAGAALGRLELEVALQTLLVHTPTLHLAVSANELTWLKDEVMRGLSQLPVKW